MSKKMVFRKMFALLLAAALLLAVLPMGASAADEYDLMPHLEYFSINDREASIDDATKNITLTLPEDTDLATLKFAFSFSGLHAEAFSLYFADELLFSGHGVHNVYEWLSDDGTTCAFPLTAFNDAEGSFMVEGTITVYQVIITLSGKTEVPVFSDVKPGGWAYPFISSAASAGLVKGIGGGKFAPDRILTRGQFAIIIARAELGQDALNLYSPQNLFSDVKADSEMGKAIAYAHSKGYISGVGNGKFQPNAPLQRQAAAKILCLINGYEEVKSVSDPFLDDAAISGWAKGYVYACRDHDLMVGSGGKLDPLGSLTRAQGAKLLCITYLSGV